MQRVGHIVQIGIIDCLDNTFCYWLLLSCKYWSHEIISETSNDENELMRILRCIMTLYVSTLLPFLDSGVISIFFINGRLISHERYLHSHLIRAAQIAF